MRTAIVGLTLALTLSVTACSTSVPVLTPTPMPDTGPEAQDRIKAAMIARVALDPTPCRSLRALMARQKVTPTDHPGTWSMSIFDQGQRASPYVLSYHEPTRTLYHPSDLPAGWDFIAYCVVP